MNKNTNETRRAIERAIEMASVSELLDMWENYAARELPDAEDLMDDMGELLLPLHKALAHIDLDALVEYYSDPPADSWVPDCLCSILYPAEEVGPVAVTYRDELGSLIEEVDPNGITFCDGFAWFTTIEGDERKVSVDALLSIC